MTLLDEIKKAPARKSHLSVSQEQVEIALAWIKDEITMSQIAKTIGRNSASTAWKLLMWIRSGVRQGLIEIKKK